MPIHDNNPNTALLTTQQVLDWLGFKRTKLHELRASGLFPLPVYLGGGSPRWRHSDLQAWLDNLEPAPSREVAKARQHSTKTREVARA